MNDFSKSTSFPNMESDYAAIMAVGAAISIEQLADAAQKFVGSLQKFCPVKTAAAFSALLLLKELQSNCLRLEVLVHLVLSCANGTQSPTQVLVNWGFDEVGEQCGHLEDPREDVFVGSVYSKRGNYRILEGIWESSTFYLQRFVNMADEFPEVDGFQQIANSIYALLKLSDEVCGRVGLDRNEIGPDGKNQILSPGSENLDYLTKAIAFSDSDLRSLGIDVKDLEYFIFNPLNRFSLRKQVIGHTMLEESPLAYKDGTLYLLLPTAVSVAIRRFFLRVLGEGDSRYIFLHQLGREYSHLFSTSPFFGGIGPDLRFKHYPCGSICAIGQRVDVGRYLSIVFFLDDILGINSDSFSGVFRGNPDLSKKISEATERMQLEFERNQDFKEGFALVVGCSVGRGVVLEGIHNPRKRWDWEFISAPDLISLSSLDEVSPLNLFRVAKMKISLRQMGGKLHNMNGLLNLFAWIDSLEGHLIPHDEILESISPVDSMFLLAIKQNGLGDLRHRLAVKIDQHVAQYVDSTWLLVRRQGDVIFQEDEERPLYVHLDMSAGKKLIGLRATQNRNWWYEAESNGDSSNKSTYERWKMMGVWIARIADDIDELVSPYIGEDPILWRCIFDGVFEDLDVNEFGSEDDLCKTFIINADRDTRTIEIQVGIGFNRAIYHPHNIAEVGLVQALLAGVEMLCGVQLSQLELVRQKKLSNPHARHSHIFIENSYRDYFREVIHANPLTINKYDVAFLKLGLGWRVRDPKLGGEITNKQECLSFINSLVARLQEDLCQNARYFEKESLLRAILRNYEIASYNRDWWHKTSAAIFALRDDKKQAMDAMSSYESKLNGVLSPARNLIEVVLCESPLENGVIPGDLDVSLLLAQAAQIFHLSGLSDLIYWNLLEPKIVIHPLGDVYACHDFLDEVIDPFGKASSEYRYTSSIKNYKKNLEINSFVSNAESTDISRTFLSAWEDEFDASLDSFRRFVDALENFGIDERKLLFTRSRSQLLQMADNLSAGTAIIRALELPFRPKWSSPPEGYTWKDISPSRFRRRLGLLRRPLIMLEPAEDPRYLIDPALVREGFVSIVKNFYYGSYGDEHLGRAMQSYVGEARDRDGAEFNQKVAAKMESLGWRVCREIKLTKLLQKNLGRDYGDVDVLAWHPNSDRVLVMECKDLQFKKTYGEIAEQLSDYRGVASENGKKRDSLRKHLDRIAILQTHSYEISRFLKINQMHTLVSILVFSHPVPMLYAGGAVRDSAVVLTYDTLELASKFIE